MISYLREVVHLFNNTDWSNRQRSLDTKLTKHIPECPNEIANYLMFLREHGRRQREQIAESSLLSYRDTIRTINDENNHVLTRLEEALNTMEPCRHISQLHKL